MQVHSQGLLSSITHVAAYGNQDDPLGLDWLPILVVRWSDACHHPHPLMPSHTCLPGSFTQTHTTSNITVSTLVNVSTCHVPADMVLDVLYTKQGNETFTSNKIIAARLSTIYTAWSTSALSHTNANAYVWLIVRVCVCLMEHCFIASHTVTSVAVCPCRSLRYFLTERVTFHEVSERALMGATRKPPQHRPACKHGTCLTVSKCWFVGAFHVLPTCTVSARSEVCSTEEAKKASGEIHDVVLAGLLLRHQCEPCE